MFLKLYPEAMATQPSALQLRLWSELVQDVIQALPLSYVTLRKVT